MTAEGEEGAATATAAGKTATKPSTAASGKGTAKKTAAKGTKAAAGKKAAPAKGGKKAATKGDGDEPDMEGSPDDADLTDVEVDLTEDLAADEPAEEAPPAKGSEDFVWDEEESEALRQARKDAELTASADSVRAYLKQIGKVALLNAEEEVELAKRIEAGLYAAERLRKAEDENEKLAPQLRRDLRWIVRDGERAKNHLLEANLRLVVSL
ncbi:RNA polymerase sigma factor, partial [Allokutzneria sp. A3M-2-11 16]